MRVYIFLCKNDTYDECISKCVFGTKGYSNKTWVFHLKSGEYCLLYHTDKKELLGLWQATGENGKEIFDVNWGKDYPNQARVKRFPSIVASLPLEKVRIYIEGDNGKKKDYVEDAQAEELLQLFDVTPIAKPSAIQNTSVFQPPFFEILKTTHEPDAFEDHVYYLLRRLGLHDVYSYERRNQAGRADGFIKFEGLAVLYDCTLRTANMEEFKAEQIKNYVSRLNCGTIQIPPHNTVSVSHCEKQVWIITRGQNRIIEIKDGIAVKEVTVHKLIEIYERRLSDKLDARGLELALRQIAV